MTNNISNFSDLFNQNFLENFQSDISLTQTLLSLSISFCLGLFIYFLYKRIFSGVLYSKSFNTALVGMALITSLIIIAINSNLVLSLGMVGALSIVRFRTPIKDATDLVFLFWSVAVGIVTGAGFYSLAIMGSVVIGLVLFFFMKKTTMDTPYLFVVHCDGAESEQAVYTEMNKFVKRFNVKQKNVTSDETELTLELRLKKDEPTFVHNITNIAGVKNSVLLSYDGDYTS
ncbi:putative membrane protein YhiD involved in acid resistance [Salibacterium salarium]|uniref:DUF4956 domain-containing protein n=1 Tax=Salibacterium salarium TaxID=284579 RepID=UPI002784827B|nr:DUF4956 domain-containing protein [Salibacterium salarium]MDQ0298336.1 putative membrane protein YhiD involved in acid resistance [Salibacterium salarium]